ncbi:MAG: ribosome biogenesis GTP-binding protein YsxC [Candidatus Taylorbacteria bacterium]|nr:ribosome biogenesis GTP-binding protein YsxC [Candidatus Taylorbacteria bacterium]
MNITSAVFVKGIRGTDPLVDMPHTGFIGRSNVGKSSLMNTLLSQKDLVKTGKTPGKTQEINFFLVNKKYYFVDVPGYGFANIPLVERQALEKLIVWYLSLPLPQRKIVLVLDAVVGPSPQDVEVYTTLKNDGVEVIVAANKIDKLSGNEKVAAMKVIANLLPQAHIVPCSSKTKEGRQELLDCIG